MMGWKIMMVMLGASVLAGAQTRVRIEGTRMKSEGELLDLIGGRLEHVRRDAASASRADDAAFLLTQVMRKDGYAEVVVEPRVVNRAEILLTVREGTRLSLGEVTVNGVDSRDAGRLAGVYSNPAVKDRPIGTGTPPFREEDVEKGLALIRQDLHANGYWAAEAVLRNRETDEEGKVNVEIDVRQGPLFRIGEPGIFSSDGRGVVRTGTTVAPFVGQTATTANLNAMRAAVEEAFISRGYPDADIRMGRRLESPRFIPEFTFDLGTRVRLNAVHVEGLRKTNPKRVEARVKRLEREWYDEAAMNKRLREFLATGAFSSVRVETEEVARKRIDATLHLQETRAKEISLGAGFGSYEGFIFRAGYTDRNLWGQLMSFSSGFEFSSRGVLGETKLVNPWLFGSDYSMTPRLYALSYGHEGYRSLETGMDVTFSRTFWEHYTLDLLFGWSLVNISTDGLARRDLGETVYTHPRMSLTQTLDYRDNPVLPKRGWHLKLPLQVGAAIGDDSTSYVKAGLSGGWYHPLGRDFQLALGGNITAIVPSGGSEDLPIDLRLFNGGARSVRSFPERELGPLSTGNNPTGGEAMWVANAEVSRAIAGPLRGVVFVDAGTLSREFADFGASDIEVAAGLGLRLDLPIGPVRLEYGYNLTRDEGEPAGALHFAIGVAF